MATFVAKLVTPEEGTAMMTVLLVLVVLRGEAYSFTVPTESKTECMVLEPSATTWLPQVLNARPQFFAVRCADVQPFVTAS